MFLATPTSTYSKKTLGIVSISLLFIICFFFNTYNRYSFSSKPETNHLKANGRSASKQFGSDRNSNLKYILLWTNPKNFPFVYFGEGRRVFIEKSCTWTNCYVTGDRGFLGDYTEFDAVVFNGPQLRAALASGDLPTRRSESQKYVYANIEAAATYPLCSNIWDGYFNWTWTYKLNSDKIWRYFVIRDGTGSVIGPTANMQWENLTNLSDHFDSHLKSKLRTKKKAAAWFVSNCNTVSRREEFVADVQYHLQNYNLLVDIYGECGPMQCPKQIMSRCLKMLERDYYFYFAFENAFSEDYVTEKVLYALNHYTVPVVYGGANYSRFLPPNSYLDAQALGASELASRMADLVRSPAHYRRMFLWRHHWTFHYTHERPDADVYCQFCQALNEPGIRNSSSYKHFAAWWMPNGTCSPSRPRISK